MNPKYITDTRPLVWTGSREVIDTYNIYQYGKLTHENLPFEEFDRIFTSLGAYSPKTSPHFRRV